MYLNGSWLMFKLTILQWSFTFLWMNHSSIWAYIISFYSGVLCLCVFLPWDYIFVRQCKCFYWICIGFSTTALGFSFSPLHFKIDAMQHQSELWLDLQEEKNRVIIEYKIEGIIFHNHNMYVFIILRCIGCWSSWMIQGLSYLRDLQACFWLANSLFCREIREVHYHKIYNTFCTVTKDNWMCRGIFKFIYFFLSTLSTDGWAK